MCRWIKSRLSHGACACCSDLLCPSLSPHPLSFHPMYAPHCPSPPLPLPSLPPRDVLQLKAETDVSAHLERKSLLYEQLVRGAAPDGEEREAYSVDFLRKGTLEDERLEMMAAEQGVVLEGRGGAGVGGSERVGGGPSAAAGGALDGKGIPPSPKELVK